MILLFVADAVEVHLVIYCCCCFGAIIFASLYAFVNMKFWEHLIYGEVALWRRKKYKKNKVKRKKLKKEPLEHTCSIFNFKAAAFTLLISPFVKSYTYRRFIFNFLFCLVIEFGSDFYFFRSPKVNHCLCCWFCFQIFAFHFFFAKKLFAAKRIFHFFPHFDFNGKSCGVF